MTRKKENFRAFSGCGPFLDITAPLEPLLAVTRGMPRPKGNFDFVFAVFCLRAWPARFLHLECRRRLRPFRYYLTFGVIRKTSVAQNEDLSNTCHIINWIKRFQILPVLFKSEMFKNDALLRVLRIFKIHT